jgi:hypothetical protein
MKRIVMGAAGLLLVGGFAVGGRDQTASGASVSAARSAHLTTLSAPSSSRRGGIPTLSRVSIACAALSVDGQQLATDAQLEADKPTSDTVSTLEHDFTMIGDDYKQINSALGANRFGPAYLETLSADLRASWRSLPGLDVENMTAQVNDALSTCTSRG